MQVAALFATVAGAYPKLILKHNIHIFQVTQDAAHASLQSASSSFLSITMAALRVPQLVSQAAQLTFFTCSFCTTCLAFGHYMGATPPASFFRQR